MAQVIIGYTTEGTTDVRFLQGVLHNTFVEVAAECKTDIEIVEPIIHFKKPRGVGFIEQLISCCKSADERGVMVLCVHEDADDTTDENVFVNKISPLLERIRVASRPICDNIVPIIPVRMTEAWMLADKELFKSEIGTTLSDADLGISRNPESIANPKQIIEEAIRFARADLTRRRRNELTISELYQPLGVKISSEKLLNLPSYAKFRSAVAESFRRMNYM